MKNILLVFKVLDYHIIIENHKHCRIIPTIQNWVTALDKR